MAATSGPGVAPARHGFVELLRVAGEVDAVQLVEVVMRAKVGACPAAQCRTALDTLPRTPRRRDWIFTGLRRLLVYTAAPLPGVDGLVHGRASRTPRAV